MKKYNKVNPVGIKGNEINDRMKELMGIRPINENKSTASVELTKVGPDGNAYAIIRENHNYFIKLTNKKENLVKEDFNYIGGYMNRVAYPSYEKAIKHLNLKFNSLAESFDAGHNINVFENDNLLSENGLAGGFSNHPKGGGFSGEGNLEGNTPLPMKEEEEEEEEVIEEEEEEEDGLTEAEQAIDKMNDKPKIEKDSTSDDEDIEHEKRKAGKKDKPKFFGVDKNIHEEDGIKENYKLSIAKALENMDAIIDNLTEGKVKKKVYTIK